MSLVHCGRRCGYPLNWPVGDVRAAVKHVKDHAKTAAVCFMRRICWLVRDYIAAGYLPVACGGSVGPAWARNRAGRPSRSVGETELDPKKINWRNAPLHAHTPADQRGRRTVGRGFSPTLRRVNRSSPSKVVCSLSYQGDFKRKGFQGDFTTTVAGGNRQHRPVGWTRNCPTATQLKVVASSPAQ